MRTSGPWCAATTKSWRTAPSCRADTTTTSWCSAYAIYSNTEPWGDTYLYMTTFKTDQGLVWLTTQPAMDRLTELTGLDLSQPPAADPETGFIDVSSTSYYADAVIWAVENGVTQGTGANTFSPAKTVTRAEAVTFLWRVPGARELRLPLRRRHRPQRLLLQGRPLGGGAGDYQRRGQRPF